MVTGAVFQIQDEKKFSKHFSIDLEQIPKTNSIAGGWKSIGNDKN